MSLFERFIDAPTALSGCVLWLDAMDRSTVVADATGSVSQWSDKSGLGNDAEQSNNLRRPEYRLTAFNGYPCIDYNTGSVTSRVLQTSDVSLTSHTFFAVVRGDASSGVLLCHKDDATAYVLGTTEVSHRAGRSGIFSDKNVSTTWIRDGLKKVVATRYNGEHASNLSWVNGVMNDINNRASSLTNRDPGTATATGPIYVGNQQTPNSPHRGVIAEVIVFSRALSDAERVLVERYLIKKWGIS
jgi:hypothetical protein